MGIGKEVTLENVRLSYVAFWKKSKVHKDSDVMKYGATVMVPKKSTDVIELMNDTIEEVKQMALQSGDLNEHLIDDLELPLRDGTKYAAAKKRGPEFEDMTFFTVRSDEQPSMFHKNGTPIVKTSEVYSGMWVHALVSFYFTDNGGTPRIAASISGVLKVADDKILGNRSDAKEVLAKYFKKKTNESSSFDGKK